MARDCCTDQQLRFVDEYLKDLNAAQAAIRSGYSVAAARQVASKLLTNTNVQSQISKEMDKRSQRTHISQDRVLREFARIGFSDMRNFARWGASGVEFKETEQLTDDDTACIKEISEVTNEHGGALKIRLHDKMNALVWISKHLGMDREDQNNNLNGMTPEQKLEALKELTKALESQISKNAEPKAP